MRRREVAVLFADVSGFTRLVETVEPELVYAAMRPLMDELVLLVHMHEGEIQQVLGDGFMSVFGMHSESGDEAERAVRTGLALVTAGRTRLPVHVGIEYGEVLVTPSWEPASFGVWGRPVNLAKRLCDLAQPCEVQVGPAAFARAQRRLGSATPVRTQLKGITGTVISHRLSSAIPALTGAEARPLTLMG